MAIPGDFLGVSEEFVSGEATVEEAGGIYAVAAGRKMKDESARKVWVAARKIARPLAVGDLVYGLVQDVYDTVALVEISPVPVGGRTPAWDNRMAYLRISEVKQGYVEHFRDWLRIGDYIRGRIVEIKPLGTYLTIKERDLGVVKVLCARCKEGHSFSGERGACPACGFSEQRKIPA
ncbi:exosome complex RNA-binding protein Csl4 [Candidatus Micrarchaeota archaeon]|nr:exosome complex RNA-binding protein Csl4 [Candidatus Micrarchaeota archaeon]